MLPKLFYALLGIVVAFALARGRRLERRLALVLAASVGATGLAQATLHDSVPVVAFTIIDGLVMAAAIQAWLFDRRIWEGVFVLAQAAVIAMDGAIACRAPIPTVAYHHVVYMFAYLQLGAICVGVLRSWLGPADPPPSPNSLDLQS